MTRRALLVVDAGETTCDGCEHAEDLKALRGVVPWCNLFGEALEDRTNDPTAGRQLQRVADCLSWEREAIVSWEREAIG